MFYLLITFYRSGCGKTVTGKCSHHIIFRNKELTFWYSSIDWDHVWFHGTSGGLSEWGIDNGYAGALHEDHINNPPQGWAMIDGKKTMVGHPSTDCHKSFAEKVVKSWLK